MQRMRVAGTVFLLAAIFAFGLGLGFILPRLARFGSGPKLFNTATVLQQVQTLSQLVTVKYVMEKVMVEDDVKWIAGLGENRVIMVAHGIVKAGVDLSRLQPEDVRVSGKRISIRLPPARITDAYLDDKQTRVVERTTGLLRTFDKDLEQTVRQHAVDDISRAARSSGILKDADERAQMELKFLFQQMGFQEIELETR